MAVARTAWNEMIQKRVARISNLLAQLQVVKMIGASEALHGAMQRLRIAEIETSLGERKFRVMVTGIGECLQNPKPHLPLFKKLLKHHAKL